jgi:CheY-like chemotaxis protein/anti-sigma regulatory factor (Ser/Thr protein kinase)
MRILVVDDKEVNRNVLRQMLTRKGYEVLEAVDGSEAINVVHANAVDIVLMDIMMPGMNGYEAADRIKALNKDNHIPIIYVTALRAEESLSTALAAGGDDFITKPINFAVLESKIKAHGRIRELNQQLREKNDELLAHNTRLAREQELITYFFDNALTKSYLDPSCIKHHVSPMSAFNGDAFLVARRPFGGLYALLGDFTGHGLTASMGTLPLAQTFFQMTRKSLPVSLIAREINKHLYNLLPIDIFLAAIIVEIPTSAEHITVWSGGMPDAYVIDNHRKTCEVIRAQHMPLGIVDDSEFDMDVQLFKLRGGEKLYICTDGIIESTNSAGEMFSEERLTSLLAQYQEDTFECVIREYYNFKGDREQKDDISFIEILCNNVPEEAETEQTAEDLSNANSVPIHLDIALTAKQIRTINPVSQIVDCIAHIPELKSQRDIINTVLSELYNNALEHGILQLESKNKTDDEGFLQYYNNKENALAKLETGNIFINIEFTPQNHASGGKLKIRVNDSGNGFDYQQVVPSLDAPFGRGLLLVSSLCQELTFADNGSTVEAIYLAK